MPKELATLDLADIVRDKDFQQRAQGCNPEVVEQMAEALKARAGCLPRIRVVRVKGHGDILVDGFQRCEAHQLAKLKKIAAEVITGSLLDAIVASAAANREHDASGARRTNADKLRALLFLDARLREAKQDWTNARIAEVIGVSDMFVKNHRPTQLIDVGKSEEIPLDDPPLRESRDGRKFQPPANKPAEKPKAKPEKPKPEPEPVKITLPSLDSGTWETTPIAECGFEQHIQEALDRSRVVMAGDLYKRILNGESFGLIKPDILDLRKTCENLRDAADALAPPKPPPVKKPGEVKGFDWKRVEKAHLVFAQLIDEIGASFPGEHMSSNKAQCLRSHNETIKLMEIWQKRLLPQE